MEATLRLDRYHYNDKSTIGKLYLNDEFFCYTLEDKVRLNEGKIYGKTAINAGKYKVIVNKSNRFKRLMPLLLDVPNFRGIRIHGGNTHKNTEGCLLVAKRLLDYNTIQGTMEKELTAELLKYETITIEIINNDIPQRFK